MKTSKYFHERKTYAFGRYAGEEGLDKVELEPEGVDVPGLHTINAEKWDFTKFLIAYKRYRRELKRWSRDLGEFPHDHGLELMPRSIGSLLRSSAIKDSIPRMVLSKILGLRHAGQLSADILKNWVQENSHFEELDSALEGRQLNFSNPK